MLLATRTFVSPSAARDGVRVPRTRRRPGSAEAPGPAEAEGRRRVRSECDRVRRRHRVPAEAAAPADLAHRWWRPGYRRRRGHPASAAAPGSAAEGGRRVHRDRDGGRVASEAPVARLVREADRPACDGRRIGKGTVRIKVERAARGAGPKYGRERVAFRIGIVPQDTGRRHGKNSARVHAVAVVHRHRSGIRWRGWRRGRRRGRSRRKATRVAGKRARHSGDFREVGEPVSVGIEVRDSSEGMPIITVRRPITISGPGFVADVWQIPQSLSVERRVRARETVCTVK